jgi:hypothetical protein
VRTDLDRINGERLGVHAVDLDDGKGVSVDGEDEVGVYILAWLNLGIGRNDTTALTARDRHQTEPVP